LGFKILEKQEFGKSGTLFKFVLDTPLIAKKAYAGNFIIIRINEKGERIPLTIADYNREKGTITIVFQVVGKSTKSLSFLTTGDEILDVVGPLGNKIKIEKKDHPIVIIGGGVGIAPCYPQAKELKNRGNTIISILGARNKELLFWKDKMSAVSDEMIICTDDGSEGIKGVVTEPLKEILKKREISMVIAIGPLIMMKFVCLTTCGINQLPKVKTYVSLNTIMIDGTGMCGGCRFQTIDGKSYFACVDGPDFDGHLVDFDNLLKRAKRFEEQEKESLNIYDIECRAVKRLKEAVN
jgi:ferredoxin--NADP+ reductase